MRAGAGAAHGNPHQALSLTRPSLSLTRPSTTPQPPHPTPPTQSAAFYTDDSLAEFNAGGVATAVQHNGKEMSYNNYLDADAAYSACCDFTVGACLGLVGKAAVAGHQEGQGAHCARRPHMQERACVIEKHTTRTNP